MSSATETLCGQAFGAGQYHMMGIYLQRSWLIDIVTATIMVPLFIFTTPIFRVLGEEEEIAVASEAISLWFIPILYSFVFSFTIQMYLQAQLKNLIIGWLSAASFVLHILLSWIFVNILDFGVNGALGAYNIATWLPIFGEFVYIFGGWCPNSWKGFTKAAFMDLWPVIKLSVSSGVMLCLELWYNSILVLLAGYMKNATVEISAFSICLNICAWEFMICLGFLGAACVRVSNELGKGNAKAVKFSIKVILGTSTCIGVIFWILFLVFGNEISYLFTSDEEVAEAVSSLSTLLAFSILLNSIQPVLTGVAIGGGLQGIVAIVNICCYYVFGVPIGLLLGYVAGLEVKGLWIGMLCGVLMQTIVLSFIIWRTDWDDQVKKASERLKRWYLNSPEESN
ncbi:protein DETOXIFICATION 24-like [Fagus crenata]